MTSLVAVSVVDWLTAKADGIQTLLALIVATAAFVWWLAKREHNYRANLDLKLEHIDLKDGSYLYRVLVMVQNVGVKNIEIDRVKLFIQQVVPVSEEFVFKHADRCCEFNWPTLAVSDMALPSAQSYEPGESGPIIFDYRIMECPSVVSIYVLLRNKSMWWRRLFGREDYGWNNAQIFRLSYEQESSATKPAAAASTAASRAP